MISWIWRLLHGFTTRPGFATHRQPWCDEHLGQDLPIVYLGYTSSRQSAQEKVLIAVKLSKPFLAEQLWDAIDAGRDARVPSEGVTAYWLNQDEPSLVVEDMDDNGIHILVAEDNEINAKVLQTILVNNGYRVTVAKDGQEALELTEKIDFQIALIDLHMPRLDGLGFAQAYRTQEPDGLHMPMIALSVTAPEEKKTECLEAGMDGFVVKPVAADVLAALVQRYTDGSCVQDTAEEMPYQRVAAAESERGEQGIS